MTKHALFKDGKQVSKAHPNNYAAAMEAYEHNVVIHWGPDFPADGSGVALAKGYEIREVADD